MRIGKQVKGVAITFTTVALMAACSGGGDNAERPSVPDNPLPGETTAQSTAPATPTTTPGQTPATAAETPAGSSDTAPPAASGSTAGLPDGVTPAMIAQGKQIFTGGICVTCHGPDAKGTALAPNLTDNQWIWITPGPDEYDQIVQRIHEGVPQPKEHPAPMPPDGGSPLSTDQRHAVAAYVWSLTNS